MRLRATLLLTVSACSLVGLMPSAGVFAQSRASRAQLTPAVRLAADEPNAAFFEVVPMVRTVSVHLVDVPLIEALNQIAAQGGVHLIYSPELIPAGRLVTISLRDTPGLEAIRRALAGQPVRMFSRRNMVVLVGDERPQPVATPEARPLVGVVSGQVTDAATGAALPSVSVVIEETGRGGVTDAAGRFRVTNVPAGRQRVSAISIGYRTDTEEVEVPDGGVMTVDFALEAAAVPLERLTVTGSVAETRLKELSSPISVVSARDIQQKQIQRVDQLFRGSVPGAIAWDMGPYNYYSEITVRGKNSLYFDYIKTYVDGVEVASPLYIATLDPNMIERIELVRGPQASTLYGSDAAGGVLQVFTKKGTPGVVRPQIDAKVSLGLVETDYMDHTPVTQEHSLSVSGGGQSFSYNMGGTYLQMGEYVPEANTNNTSVFGAARTSQGDLTAEISGRYYTKHFGWPLNPILRDKGYSFWQAPRDETNDIRQSTVGLNVGYQLSPSWQHNLVVGVDKTQSGNFTNHPRLLTPADTFVTVSSGESSRASLRYNTSLDLDVSDLLTAHVTGGIDYYVYNAASFYTEDANRNEGRLDATNVSLTRLDYSNTGYFVQSKLGFDDALFFTAGLRAERNENFGSDYGTALAPRVGIAYSRSLRDNLDLKLRASWGEGIRAPQPYHKQESITASQHILGNPDIGPEEQRGWDAGLELYFGDRASFLVTYYDQTAINLIDAVLLDAGAEPAVYQYQNVGEMKNNGWELEGSLNLHPVRITGTFSTVTSDVVKLAPGYTGDLQVGDHNLKIPEKQGGLSVAFDVLRGSATVDLTYIGSFVNTDWIALYGYYYGGEEYRGSERAYWIDYDPITRLGLRMEQAITNQINGFIRVENLTNKQLGERDNAQVTAGRTTVVGLRIAR